MKHGKNRQHLEICQLKTQRYQCLTKMKVHLSMKETCTKICFGWMWDSFKINIIKFKFNTFVVVCGMLYSCSSQGHHVANTIFDQLQAISKLFTSELVSFFTTQCPDSLYG